MRRITVPLSLALVVLASASAFAQSSFFRYSVDGRTLSGNTAPVATPAGSGSPAAPVPSVAFTTQPASTSTSPGYGTTSVAAF